MKKFGERNGQCNMLKYFDITKMEYIVKGYATQVTTYEKPVELIIDPKNKEFKVNNGFWRNFIDGEVTFITKNNSIIKYRDNKLTIVSEKILK